MTVKELIAQLQALPQDAPVVVPWHRALGAFQAAATPAMAPRLRRSPVRESTALYWDEPTGDIEAVVIAPDLGQ